MIMNPSKLLARFCFLDSWRNYCLFHSFIRTPSDLPQALGKYSYAYSSIFAINGGLLLGLGILLLYRQRINACACRKSISC